MANVAGRNETALGAGAPGSGPSADGFTVYVVTGDAGGLAAWPFNFIAIGTR